YALENRSALARVVPELFKDHNVTKLGGFFNSMMQAFLDIAPQGKEQPRIVLLTPGPRNETYFEHAFLASHMGFTLAQGDDLVARSEEGDGLRDPAHQRTGHQENRPDQRIGYCYWKSAVAR